jgi:hypothetical protein
MCPLPCILFFFNKTIPPSLPFLLHQEPQLHLYFLCAHFLSFLHATSRPSSHPVTHTFQIYRNNDQPLYRRGNLGLIILISYNMIIIIGAKLYYRHRNHSKDKIWSSMTSEEKARYLETTDEKGNKRYVLSLSFFLLNPGRVC